MKIAEDTGKKAHRTEERRKDWCNDESTNIVNTKRQTEWLTVAIENPDSNLTGRGGICIL